jgi:hypothetical protein
MNERIRQAMIFLAAAVALGAAGCADLSCEEDCPDSVERTACDLCAIGPVPESSCVEDYCID